MLSAGWSLQDQSAADAQPSREGGAFVTQRDGAVETSKGGRAVMLCKSQFLSLAQKTEKKK